MIRVRFAPGVDPRVKASVRSFVAWARSEGHPWLDVRVWVGRGDELRQQYRDIDTHETDGNAVLGLFLWDDDWIYPRIRVAGGRSRYEVVGTLAHELVHFRQWLTTGRVTERGVEVAARGMIRRWQAWRTSRG